MMQALTATMPGMDCAMATMSRASLSSIQPYSSTYFAFNSGMMTKPPPMVTALMTKVEEKSFQ